MIMLVLCYITHELLEPESQYCSFYYLYGTTFKGIDRKKWYLIKI